MYQQPMSPDRSTRGRCVGRNCSTPSHTQENSDAPIAANGCERAASHSASRIAVKNESDNRRRQPTPPSFIILDYHHKSYLIATRFAADFPTRLRMGPAPRISGEAAMPASQILPAGSPERHVPRPESWRRLASIRPTATPGGPTTDRPTPCTELHGRRAAQSLLSRVPLPRCRG